MQKPKHFIFILILLIVATLAVGCTQGNTPASSQESEQEPEQNVGHYFERVYENTAYNLAFSYPKQWAISSESESDGVLTLTLKEGNTLSLVISVLPGEFPEAELVKNGEKLLTGSLYNVRGPLVKDNKVLSGRPVTFLAAEAGERDALQARSALFTEKDHSYFFTLLAQAEQFPVANETFELIVSGVK